MGGPDRKTEKLAKLCALGDTAAMEALSARFRAACSPALGALLDRYEAAPVYANEKALTDYWPWHPGEDTVAMGYVLWKMRAALYRGGEAALALAPLGYYRRWPYITYDMLLGREFMPRSVWSGDILRRMGILDIPSGHEDCSIQAYAPLGIYIFRYVSGYIPADQEGFGAEYDADHVYLDEFFNRLPVNTLEEVPEALKALDRRRDRHWAAAKRGQKYARRLWETQQG